MNFQEKVQSMSAKEIILAMVEGLENPKVKINMDTFGKFVNGTCYGCAATNIVCQISGITFTPNNIYNRERALGLKGQFLSRFEYAIDWLRRGKVDAYNDVAIVEDFAPIEDTIGLREHQVYLISDYTQSDLDVFRLLAFSQPEK